MKKQFLSLNFDRHYDYYSRRDMKTLIDDYVTKWCRPLVINLSLFLSREGEKKYFF